MQTASFLLFVLAGSLQAPEATATRPAWQKAETHEFAVATPPGFDRRPQSSPTMILYVGREATDESGQPLRRGLTIERIPDRSTDDARAAAEQLLARFKADPGFKLNGEPHLQTLQLAGGTRAALLRVEAFRGPDRRTAIGKLIATDGRLRWVVSVFVTAGRTSALATCDSEPYRSLEPYLRTFTLNPQQFSAAPLEPVQPASLPAEGAGTAPSTQPE